MSPPQPNLTHKKNLNRCLRILSQMPPFEKQLEKTPDRLEIEE